MLTTPKLMPDLVSSPASMSGGGSRGSQREGEDEMLTTPVLTTPKTSELWPPMEDKSADAMGVLNLTRNSPLTSKHDVLPLSFSPTTLAATSTLSPPASNVRELLPLDSDIGLRSPCDGLLAKRRKYKLKQASNSGSDANENSNQNSPRDLSKNGNSDNSEKRDTVSPDVVSSANAKALTKTSEPSSTDFKLPRKSMPAHYTPSPLAVPSPNWMAVERYLDMSSKTPKLLDSAIFDFLGPATPRTKHSREGRSPSAIEYQRLSPRFPIPETPTDLSSSKVEVVDNGVNGAQDLSIKATTNQEATKRSNVDTIPSYVDSIKMESTSSPPQAPMTAVSVKSETPDVSEALLSRPQSYSYPCSTSMAGHGVLAHPPHALYDRGGYAESHLGHAFPAMGPLRSHSASPPPAAAMAVSLAAAAMQQACYSSHHLWMSGGGAVVNPVARPQLHPSALPPTWTLPVPSTTIDNEEEEEEATSPPPMYPVFPSTVPPTSATRGRGRGRRGGGDVGGGEGGRRRKTGNKGAGAKKTGATNSDGSKRVYACPHCQRTYDWNYNLNRHLKYECGKENAFQCSKCGRKFPHKQNCVYHLKRKHKIVCDTIDEYMAKGLVLFRGAESLGQAGEKSQQIKSEPPELT